MKTIFFHLFCHGVDWKKRKQVCLWCVKILTAPNWSPQHANWIISKLENILIAELFGESYCPTKNFHDMNLKSRKQVFNTNFDQCQNFTINTFCYSVHWCFISINKAWLSDMPDDIIISCLRLLKAS